MSLCNSTMQDKVMNHEIYPEIKCNMNTLKILREIKQFMYSNGSEELHTVYNQVLSTINMFQMRQEMGQWPQNFQDSFTAIIQVCDQLALCIGHTKQRAKADQKREGVTNRSCEQLKETKRRQRRNILLYCIRQIVTDLENSSKRWKTHTTKEGSIS